MIDEGIECSQVEIAENYISCNRELEIDRLIRRSAYCGFDRTYMEQTCEEWAGTEVSETLCFNVSDTLCDEAFSGSCRLVGGHHDGQSLRADFIDRDDICEISQESSMSAEDVCAEIGLALDRSCYDDFNEGNQDKALPPVFDYDRCIDVQYCSVDGESQWVACAPTSSRE